MNFLFGELKRKKQVKTKLDKPYRISFALSMGIIFFAIILGGILNPQAVLSNLRMMLYIAAGGNRFCWRCFWCAIFCYTRISTASKKVPLIVKKKGFNKIKFRKRCGYFHSFLPVTGQTTTKITAITSNMFINAPTPGKAKNPTNQSMKITIAIANHVFIANALLSFNHWS